LTVKGFDKVIATGIADLGVVYLELVYNLDAFSHWPPHRLENKMRILADLHESETDEDKLRLWCAAEGILGAYDRLI
jgi:hypothetical protein